MATEEFYAHALLSALRSQETNNLLSEPKENEVVSLANDLAVLLNETYDKNRKRFEFSSYHGTFANAAEQHQPA
jgi:hypothetical protein